MRRGSRRSGDGVDPTPPTSVAGAPAVSVDDGPAVRACFLTPAAATLLFLAARLFLGFGDGPEASAAGLAGESASPDARVRVVAEIPSASETRVEAHRVPATERELLELFRRDGAIHFGPGEVEPVTTPTREFTLEEVGVILVEDPAR